MGHQRLMSDGNGIASTQGLFTEISIFKIQKVAIAKGRTIFKPSKIQN
jgi:hypothetical protein